MSFLTTLVAILNDQENIPEIPMGELVSYDIKGKILPQKISTKTSLKIARLQTLMLTELRIGAIPEYEEITNMARGMEANPAQTVGKCLDIQKDTVSKANMIERLIVEIVREAVPQEYERLEVKYYLNFNLQLVRVPATKTDSLK